MHLGREWKGGDLTLLTDLKGLLFSLKVSDAAGARHLF